MTGDAGAKGVTGQKGETGARGPTGAQVHNNIMFYSLDYNTCIAYIVTTSYTTDYVLLRICVSIFNVILG